MAVPANRWHPLAFDARSYGLRRTVAQLLFSPTSGALPPPGLLGAIDTRSPTTHPPTHRRSFVFHFYHAASIMAANSSSCIGTDPLADPNSLFNSTTPPTVTVSAPPDDKLNSTAGTSAARPASPNAPAHLRSKAYAQSTVTGAVCSTPEIAGVRTGRRHRRCRQCTRDRRRANRAPSPALSAVHPKSQAWAHGAVTGAVRSLYPVTL